MRMSFEDFMEIIFKLGIIIVLIGIFAEWYDAVIVGILIMLYDFVFFSFVMNCKKRWKK